MDALKTDVIKRISKDLDLFGEVGNTIGVVPSSLLRLLRQNHKKLRHPSVLKVLRKRLGLSEAELLQEKPEVTEAA